MTHQLQDLRNRLGLIALAAAEANAPTVVVSRQDMRTILVVMDELIEPAAEREVKL